MADFWKSGGSFLLPGHPPKNRAWLVFLAITAAKTFKAVCFLRLIAGKATADGIRSAGR